MKRTTIYYSLTVCFILGLTFSGCGKKAEETKPLAPPPQAPAPPPPVSACALGYSNIAGGPCFKGDFATVCRESRGIIIQTTPTSVCRLEKYLPGSTISYQYTAFPYLYPYYYFPSSIYVMELAGFFPRLNKSNPKGPYAFNTRITVKNGNLLRYEGTGSWGGNFEKSGSFLGIPVWKASCDQIGIDGKKAENGDALPDYDGLPPGLVASDGTEVFLLSTRLAKKIGNEGELMLGFNTSLESGSCANAQVKILSVSHCEDSSGKVTNCP